MQYSNNEAKLQQLFICELFMNAQWVFQINSVIIIISGNKQETFSGCICFHFIGFYYLEGEGFGDNSHLLVNFLI